MRQVLYQILAFFFICVFISNDIVGQNHLQKAVVPVKRINQDSLLGFNEKEYKEHLIRGHHLTKRQLDSILPLVRRNYIKETYFNKPSSQRMSSSGNPTTLAGCSNMDFELGTTTGWVTAGDANIVSTGNDFYGNFPLSAPGGNFSLKLGDRLNCLGAGALPTPPSSASRTFSVDPANPFFTYRYAIVFLGFNHALADAARVDIDVYDQANNLIPCTHYEAIAQFSGGAGLIQSPRPQENNKGGQGPSPIYYRPWTDVSIDLTAYIGQNVTIVFRNRWCVCCNYDWSYSYVDGSCGTIQVVQKPTCNAFEAALVAPKGFATYAWSGPGILSGQGTDSIVVNQIGTYTLNATTLTGCSISPMTYTVTNLPSVGMRALFSYTPTNCVGTGTTVSFSDFSTPSIFGPILNWKWDVGNDGSTESTSQNYSYAFPNLGTFPVKLTVSNANCTDDTIINISVNKSKADFLLANACMQSSLNFTNTSTPAASISGQTWYWGDGAVSINASSLHTYTNSGNYNVKLVITNTSNCKDSITYPITIYPVPVMSFSAVPVCLGFASTFTNNTSVLAPDNIIAWAWDYDNNGSTDNVTQNTPMTFTTSGIHPVELKAISNNNCRDSSVVNILVNASPTATFSASSACLNGNITLNNTSSIPAPNSISLYTWDFGPNATPAGSSNQAPTSLSYNLYGIKTITLTIKANTTCTAVVTQTVEVYSEPVPNVVFTNKCINAQPFNFDASSSNIAGTGIISSYDWIYGDGATGSGVIATHTYGSAALYNVTLKTTSDKGCFATLVKQVEVYQKPLMSIVNSNACDTKAMNFSTVPQLNTGNVVNWYWDFNNTITSIEANGPNSSNIFPAAGNQTVAVVLETDKGCRDTISKLVYVDYVPKPLFTVDYPKGCSFPHCVTFSDNTTQITAPGYNATWKWVFGDGSVISSTTNGNQPHCYKNASSSQSAFYNVKLLVTTDRGCVDSLEKMSYIEVYPKPVAQYETNPSPSNVLTPLVYFTNQSLNYTKWWWNFGETVVRDSVNVNPTHFYDSEMANTYSTYLIVSNQYGCTDTAYAKVEVGPEFVFYIPNAFTPDNEDGLNDIFTGKGIGIGKFEMWIFDRWGSAIYYTDDITKGWDGKVQGKSLPCQQDVYVWQVKLKDVLGKKHDYIGHVTLLR